MYCENVNFQSFVNKITSYLQIREWLRPSSLWIKFRLIMWHSGRGELQIPSINKDIQAELLVSKLHTGDPQWSLRRICLFLCFWYFVFFKDLNILWFLNKCIQLIVCLKLQYIVLIRKSTKTIFKLWKKLLRSGGIQKTS